MSKLLTAIQEKQKTYKYGPENAVEKVYNELNKTDKADFISAIEDYSLHANVIAATIINQNLSSYATEIGEKALTVAIRRVRRGETRKPEVAS